MVRDRQGRIYIWASMGCRPGVPSLEELHHLNKYIDTQGCGGGGGGGVYVMKNPQIQGLTFQLAALHFQYRFL